MLRQIHEGHQCYMICPLIEDSDNEKMAEIESAEATFKKLTDYFSTNPEVRVSLITGNMKVDDIAENIADFAANRTQILVSTTIVEVGVNVPNATVMVIKNAERFGLAPATPNFLRGRNRGRGNAQSYCVLLSSQDDNQLASGAYSEQRWIQDRRTRY